MPISTTPLCVFGRSVLAMRALVLIALLCVSVAASNAAAPDPLAVAFGTMPALWNVRMSPDGTKVSLLQMHPDDLPILRIFDLTTGKANLALASTKDGFDIQWCDWANNERLLCGFSAVAKGWDAYGVTRLVAVNADGSAMKVLLQRKLKGQFAQFQDRVVDWLVDDPKRVLVVMPNNKGATLNPLDIYSGGTGSAKERHSGFVHWISDGRGLPRLYRYVTQDQIRWSYRLSGKKRWHLLDKYKMTDLDHDFQPLGFGEDPDRLLVFKPHEGRLALWSMDLKGEEDDELVFSSPEVDVDGVEYLGKFRRMVAIGYSTDRPHLHFFDKAVEKISDKLATHFERKSVGVIDESWDRRYYIVHVGSDRDPGTYYRFDVKQDQLLAISPQYPLLESQPLAPMEPIRYPARDGAEIPGYLTLPAAGAEGARPTVILPHGGPESRDYWEFDWLSQFMAAKGYAVLQSNYRGSGGYGSDWSGEGGFRAWRTAINDLTDGAAYLVEEGIADPNRICVVGWSYGGYAALMSGVEGPDRYRCLVSIAGVTDPVMLIDQHRHFLNRKGVAKFIGRDKEVIKHGSPLKRASEIRAPVLLFHGDQDLNVSVDHSQKMAKALKRAKKSVEYIEYEDAEHSILRNGYRVDMLDRIGSFLDAHIGQPTTAP
jgi:dipeptidyl aminopeptidase/acylaminoacyl peptidase